MIADELLPGAKFRLELTGTLMRVISRDEIMRSLIAKDFYYHEEYLIPFCVPVFPYPPPPQRKSSMQLSEQKDDNTLPITAVLIGQTFIPENMGTQAVFMRVSAQMDLSPHIWAVNLSTGVSLRMSNNAHCVLVDVQGTWVVRK